MSRSEQATADRRILVTALGTRHDPVEYSLGGKRCSTGYAGAALAQLLDLRGARCVLLATPESAERHAAAATRELEAAGVVTDVLPVPTARSEEEIFGVVDKLATVLPVEAEVNRSPPNR